jgi:23S rRNA pseudouridine1911/1915/1917 synthase
LAKTSPEVIYENDDFIAVNKPAGVLTIPDRFNSELPSLSNMLEHELGRVFTIHRLDRETTGLILFAKNETAHKHFSLMFEHRAVEKYYAALVLGSPISPNGKIEEPIAEHPVFKGQMYVHKKGKPSLTEYKVLEEHKQFSLVQFQLHTGRTHQIRVHMKHLGNPIACDELYGNGKPILLSSIKKKFKLSQNEEAEKPLLSRLALHSYKLKFKDVHGEQFELTAELPKDMRAVLQQLRKMAV